MNSTQHNSNTDTFDLRLRNDLDGIARSTPTAEPGRFDPSRLSTSVGEQSPRRGGAYLLAAAAVAALTVTGAIAVSTRSSPPPAVSEPAASNTLPAAPPEQADPCNEQGCSDFDPLPVASGVSDFYVGPASLGDPVIALDHFDQLTRCTELSADFTTCVKIEGIAGVPTVAYPAVGDVAATSDPGDGFDSSPDTTVLIGTTFGDIAPPGYAAIWGPTQGDGPQEATTVRGHDAIRYLNEASPALVWQERPGVLVWVVVPPNREDELVDIAENLQRIDGPTTIPYRVTVPELSTEWDMWDNDGNGLISARSQGVACVGLDYVDTCGTDIADRTIIRTRTEGVVRVAGSTPSDIASVRIDVAGGEAVGVETIAFADSASRYFSTVLDPDIGPITEVTWLAADGEIATLMSVPGIVEPDASPDAVDDTPAPTCTVPGACGTYVVLANDTPAIIAAKFCLSLDELLGANGGGYDSFSNEGTSIQIPLDDGRTTCPEVGEPADWAPTPTTSMVPVEQAD